MNRFLYKNDEREAISTHKEFLSLSSPRCGRVALLASDEQPPPVLSFTRWLAFHFALNCERQRCPYGTTHRLHRSTALLHLAPPHNSERVESRRVTGGAHWSGAWWRRMLGTWVEHSVCQPACSYFLVVAWWLLGGGWMEFAGRLMYPVDACVLANRSVDTKE